MANNYRNGSDDDGSTVDDSTICVNCCSYIDTSEWYPVVTELSGESVILYAFCDDECLDEWQAENPQSQQVDNGEPS